MEYDNLKLVLIGINHKSSTINEREIFQLETKIEREFLEYFYSMEDVEGIIILSTCNRIEFYMIIHSESSPFDIISKAYNSLKIDTEKHRTNFYQLEDKEVTEHLFRVISGLDSLVIGEYQIQGQVKEAYSRACDVKTVDKILHKLFHAAFRTGKKVRSDTTLGEGRRSVSGMAAQLMIDNIDKSGTVCIIGVNENTKIMAEKLKSEGFNNFIFVNRTRYKAGMLADEYNGKVIEFDKLEKALSLSNAVYTCTGAPSFIIDSGMINRLHGSNNCPKLFVDMAVPRDIESNDLPNDIKVYDIDNLQRYLDEQMKNRVQAIKEAEQIIEQEVSIFQEWSEMRTNTILEPYSEKFEIIRQQIMDEYKNQLPEAAYEKADKLSRSLVHRMQSTFVRALIRTNQELKVFLQHRDSM
jgi:glutamyl-tRNA reductase